MLALTFLMISSLRSEGKTLRDEASKAALIRLIEEHTPHALKILITHDRGEAESMAETVYDLSGPPLRILEEKQP